jgi:XTP/dITP diphosphohydrolase
MKKRLLLGTTNQVKTNIVREAVQSLPLQILSLSDLNIGIEVTEDGDSPEENAEKKARVYFAEARMPTLTIDGALYIEKFSLEKQPGVLVRRIYGGSREVADKELLDYYVRELEKVGGESLGIWRAGFVLMTAHDQIFRRSFLLKVKFTAKKKGRAHPGSPLDVMMVDPTTGKYYSEMAYQEREDFRWAFEFMKQHLKFL